jgi:SAM-dependent methyltransferase
MVDIGSGESTPYKRLFDHRVYVGADRFERADVLSDAAFLPIASNRADLVLCTEVLEHLPEPAHALAEMNRVLVPSGFLIVTVPLIWGEHSYVDYQRWTESGLRKVLQSSGFEVHEIRRRGGIFSVLGMIITRVPYQMFGELGQQQSWLSKMLYIACWLAAAPIPWFLALLDGLDHRKAFTIGYSFLCQKKRVLENG